AAIAVMDSPMFARDREGDAMVRDMAARVESDGSVREFARTGAGYLTFGSLDAVAPTIGLRAEFVRSRGSIAWRLRRGLGGPGLGPGPRPPRSGRLEPGPPPRVLRSVGRKGARRPRAERDMIVLYNPLSTTPGKQPLP